LYRVINRRYEEIYRITAEFSPDAVIFGDNVDGVLVTPNLFSTRDAKLRAGVASKDK